MGNLLSSKKKKIQLEQKRFGYEKDIKTKEFELNKLKHCFQERTSQLSIADEELDDQLNRARSELQTLKQEYDAAQEAAKDPVEIVYLKASLENLQKNMQETFNEIKERSHGSKVVKRIH